MKITIVIAFAICALVFLLLPDDSQAGKTKKGPLVTEKVGLLQSSFPYLMFLRYAYLLISWCINLIAVGLLSFLSLSLILFDLIDSSCRAALKRVQ